MAPVTKATKGRPPTTRRDLELKVLAIQSGVAAFYCIFTVAGVFPARAGWWQAAVAWIAVYHVFHTVYVLRWRVRGRHAPLAETLTPVLDISCITAAWAAVGEGSAAIWALYLYGLVGYSRWIFGWRYAAVAAWAGANVVAARALIAVGTDQPVFDASLSMALVATAAIAALSSSIGATWREAERRARYLAEVDPLTGVANRRTFLEGLDSLATDGAPFAVLMLDLDDFKRLNDEHGHLYGDRVLADVAAVLAANVRGNDRLARYGGEEFIIAMPGASLTEARSVADRLRLAVADGSPASVSVGCAARETGEEAEHVVRRADDMLLRAKRSGKNRILVDEGLRRSA